MSEAQNPKGSERSLFALLRDLPGLFMDLIRAEFEQLKREIARKLKHLGIGAAYLIVALILLSFFVFTLIVAGIFALGLVMPYWAAALTMAGILLALIALLIGLAVMQFKKGNPPLPTETFDSIVDDANAIRGEGSNVD